MREDVSVFLSRGMTMGADNASHVINHPVSCLRVFPGGNATVAGAIVFVEAALKAWQLNRYPFGRPPYWRPAGQVLRRRKGGWKGSE